MVVAGESERLEFKSTTKARREAAKTVCAMIRPKRGNLLFGVMPDGRVTGQQADERTMEDVSAELATIDPPACPSPSVEHVRPGEGLAVIVVSASRGRAAPCRHRGNAH